MISSQESKGTVLFDSKKFKKIIKLNESGQKGSKRTVPRDLWLNCDFEESKGTVLFDFKKFRKTIKLNESGQKEPSLMI